jgi:hypothetical protein
MSVCAGKVSESEGLGWTLGTVFVSVDANAFRRACNRGRGVIIYRREKVIVSDKFESKQD